MSNEVIISRNLLYYDKKKSYILSNRCNMFWYSMKKSYKLCTNIIQKNKMRIYFQAIYSHNQDIPLTEVGYIGSYHYNEQ